MALISVEDAIARVTAEVGPVDGRERLPLAEAAGRVLAVDVAALRTHPPFPASAMDGYAVKSADAAPGAELTVIGESAAGHGFDGHVEAGQAVRIFTGAPMPHGANAVVIQENVEKLDDGRIRLGVGAEPGRHVRMAGIDFAEHEIGLHAGRVLDATAITLAAAMNHPALDVVARPKVAILATGDELRLPGSELGPGQIIASNTFGIAALVRENGADVIDLGIAPDRMEALESAIDSAVRLGADVLVTIGGASVGDHDLVQKALAARGMELDFWRIAMRPGKPLMHGRLGPMQVLGLPGNPASSLVCAYLFLEPLVALLGGRKPPQRLKKAFLGKDLPENDVRQDYLRGKLMADANGRLIATPMTKQDSSLMRVFSDANCLIVRPPHAPAAHLGEATDVLVLRS
jgi:Molybdopterin biosynthesis enzyme